MTLVNKHNILPAPLDECTPPSSSHFRPTLSVFLTRTRRDGEIRKGGGRRIPPLLPFADNHWAVSALYASKARFI